MKKIKVTFKAADGIIDTILFEIEIKYDVDLFTQIKNYILKNHQYIKIENIVSYQVLWKVLWNGT